MSDQATFVVVDIWKVKAGMQDELDAVLVESGRRFRAMDGVVSVDYTRMANDPERYLVIFRYRDAAAREAFVSTEALQSTMDRLRPLWDLESPIYHGVALPS